MRIRAGQLANVIVGATSIALEVAEASAAFLLRLDANGAASLLIPDVAP